MVLLAALTQPACLFCQIVAREVGAEVVFEDDVTVAFLDHRPLFPGHCLVLPRSHHETLADLPPELMAPVFARVQRLSRAVERGMDAHGTFVALNNKVSQSVPHLHVHVVPRRFKDGLRGFFWPRQKYESASQMAEVAARVRAALSAMA